MADQHGRTPRGEQRDYSRSMAAMVDEAARRRKAAKIIAVLRHALGRDDGDDPAGPLSGLRALDVGCSAGFIADELAEAGAETIGVDIDEDALHSARERFSPRVDFQLARADALPLPDGSVDVAVFNHIYEHVADPEAVVAEIRRVLAPTGVLYLGLANRLGIIEPHYRLPFLSWLPAGAPADSYLRATRRGEHYYERLHTRGTLRRLFWAYDLWDYTIPVLADPQAFAGDDLVPGWVGRLPDPLLVATLPLVPTYIWVAFATPARPGGGPLRAAPRRLTGAR